MFEDPKPDTVKLNSAREAVQSFMVKRKRSTTVLFFAALAAELTFFVLMLCFMEFGSRLHWFLLFGFLLVYSPLILFSWHNSVKIDHLYYRLVDELKYDEHPDP
jgi:hypothetical protein